MNNNFSTSILNWYQVHRRSLPWRGSKNPYFIWLSEIIMQQTRIAQGTPYYLNFVHAFPTVYDLAKAHEKRVLKLWQGLGYYSRARNLHKTARLIVKEYHGIFPNTYKDLIQLPGIGPYTASAISSICFDEPKAVVDGNVYRVLSRFFNIDFPINTPKGIKYYAVLAQELLAHHHPGTFNQAIMEFGALQCTPKNPQCNNCLFHQNCKAYSLNLVKQRPVKIKKTSNKRREFNYLVSLSKSKYTILTKRIKKDIWQHLYEFPLIEGHFNQSFNELKQSDQFPEWAKNHPFYLYNEIPYKHQLTHQYIEAYFWVAEIDNLNSDNVIEIDRLNEFPISRLTERFLQKFFL